MLLRFKTLKLPLVLFAVTLCLFLLSPRLRADTVALKNKNLSDSFAHYMMGIFYDYQNKLDDAVREYKQAVALANESAQLRLRLGAVYVRKSEFDKAIVELKQARVLDPDNLEAGLMLALIYTSQNKQDEASLEYERVLQKASLKDPKNIDILKGLGAVYYQRGNIDAAIKSYSLALDINKEDCGALFLLGSLLEEARRRTEAIGKLKQALALCPDYADALNSLGYIYAEEGKNLGEAERLINKALSKEPDNGAYIDSLGWVYYKKKLLDKAIKELERASSLLPDSVIFDHLGDAYFKKGNKDKAASIWKKSLELNPKKEKVKEKIKKLEDKR